MNNTPPAAGAAIVYVVIDSQTGDIVSQHASKARARSKRDRLDLEYGAVRYRVEEAN